MRVALRRDDRVLHYPDILKQIRALSNPPSFTLEMDEVDFMRASLPFLDLGQPQSILTLQTPNKD